MSDSLSTLQLALRRSRSLYTKKEVKTPADLKGLKIRVMGNPLFVDTMNAMGGNGITMGHNDTFSALQTLSLIHI